MLAVNGDLTSVRLQFPSHPRHISLARMLAGAVAEQGGFGPERVADIRLLVSEACTNAVRAQQARGVVSPITLVCREDGVFHVEIVDATGAFFDGSMTDVLPDVVGGQGENGGFGLPLMHRIADRLSFFENADGGTTVTFSVRKESSSMQSS